MKTRASPEVETKFSFLPQEEQGRTVRDVTFNVLDLFGEGEEVGSALVLAEFLDSILNIRVQEGWGSNVSYQSNWFVRKTGDYLWFCLFWLRSEISNSTRMSIKVYMVYNVLLFQISF